MLWLMDRWSCLVSIFQSQFYTLLIIGCLIFLLVDNVVICPILYFNINKYVKGISHSSLKGCKQMSINIVSILQHTLTTL